MGSRMWDDSVGYDARWFSDLQKFGWLSSGNTSGSTGNVGSTRNLVSYKSCQAGQLHVPNDALGSCVQCSQISTIAKGMYCPGGGFQPRLCRKGHYCPDPESEIIAPAGYYARSGWQSAQKCHEFLRKCEEGSDVHRLSMYAWIIFFSAIVVVLFVIRMFIFYHRERQMMRNRKRQSMAKKLEAIEQDFFSQIGVEIKRRQTLQGFTQKFSGIPVSFENVTMKLKSNGKTIVDNVSGTFPPKCTAAVMGPSGGGKTSFMNALAGRANAYATVEGTIIAGNTVDGITKFPTEIGFVPQDDVMHEDLTVYQNLYYAARLKLPADMPYEQKMKIVDDVLEVLEIGHIKDSVVGGVGKRGISGGQKKRVNIGLELVGYPRILFLDEPTSGLDSTASLHVARCLLRLRRLGISTICVIHQPRYSVFTCFSDLLLLAPGGKVVYLADTIDVQEYFIRLGFKYSAGENVADWMLDILTGGNYRYNAAGEVDTDFSIGNMVNEWKVESEDRFRDCTPKGLTFEEARAKMERLVATTETFVAGKRTDSKVKDSETDGKRFDTKRDSSKVDSVSSQDGSKVGSGGRAKVYRENSQMESSACRRSSSSRIFGVGASLTYYGLYGWGKLTPIQSVEKFLRHFCFDDSTSDAQNLKITKKIMVKLFDNMVLQASPEEIAMLLTEYGAEQLSSSETGGGEAGLQISLATLLKNLAPRLEEELDDHTTVDIVRNTALTRKLEQAKKTEKKMDQKKTNLKVLPEDASMSRSSQESDRGNLFSDGTKVPMEVALTVGDGAGENAQKESGRNAPPSDSATGSKTGINRQNSAGSSSVATGSDLQARKRVGFFSQIQIFVSRNLMQFDLGNFVTYVTLSILAGAMVGRIIGEDVVYIQYPAVAAGPSTLFGLISSSISITLYSSDAEAYKREMKQVSTAAYFIAKQVVDLPCLVVMPAAFGASYFFQTNMDFHSYHAQICFLLVHWYISGFAQWVSIWVSKDKTVLVAVLAPAILSAMFGGTGVTTLRNMNNTQLFLSQLSPGRWYTQLWVCFAYSHMPENVLTLQPYIDGMENFGYYKDMGNRDELDVMIFRSVRVLAFLGIWMRILAFVSLRMMRDEIAFVGFISAKIGGCFSAVRGKVRSQIYQEIAKDQQDADS